jgi:transcriptional regulator with XRE-family HTH domain
MPKRTLIQLRRLVAEREIAEGRSYTYKEIARDAGVSVDFVHRMMNNTVQNVSITKADKLLDWLGVDWNTLMQRVDVDEESPEHETPLAATA